MNYTEKYHLPQWKKEDRIMMEDFNQMCADIESGLKSNAQAAEAAQQAAADLPYAVGSFVGNGDVIREFDLGFRPRFLIICTDQALANDSVTGTTKVMAGPTVTSRRIFLTDTGFRLDRTDSVNKHPIINENGKAYDYIAFR